MNRFSRSGLGLTLMSVVGLSLISAGAHAATDPLLVVVEGAPSSGLDAGEIRRSIGRELSRRVVAPTDPEAPRSSQVLLVVSDGGHIAMSLRSTDAGSAARTILAPRERAADLQAIAWLAGNLARDQVGMLIAAAPAPLPTTPPPTRAEMSSRVEPPSLAISSSGNGDADLVTTTRWTVSAAGGPTFGTLPSTPKLFGTMFSIEAHHEVASGGLIMGGALETGPDGSGAALPHYFGLAGLVGARWLRGPVFFEGTLGLGLEAIVGFVVNSTVTSSTKTGTTAVSSLSTQAKPGLYARAVGTLGVPLNRSFDFVASLGVHLTPADDLSTDYVVSAVGLRLRIP
jgi:hypothetical protein